MKHAIVILAGVMGAGKTTVGMRLAEVLGWQFFDADDFHTEASRLMLAAGVPLTAADRQPWVERLQQLIRSIDARGEAAVVACSALTEAIRNELAAASPSVTFVFLEGSRELIRARLSDRTHFARASLLDSQFETLEKPVHGIVVDVAEAPDEIVRHILTALSAR